MVARAVAWGDPAQRGGADAAPRTHDTRRFMIGAPARDAAMVLSAPAAVTEPAAKEEDQDYDDEQRLGGHRGSRGGGWIQPTSPLRSA
jgi:hypothetical protein